MIRISRLQAIDTVIIERRDISVLLWAETLQPWLAGMNPKWIRPLPERTIGHTVEGCFRVLIVNANAALHGDRYRHRCLHSRNATLDNLRCLHQACAERSRLHAIGGAADVQVDFIITLLG